MKIIRTAVVLALAALAGSAVPAAADGPGFHLEQVASGFKRPLYVTAHAGPNRLYVVEQRGVIMVMKRNSASSPWVKAGIFLDLRSKVAGPLIGRGLLGMAFHPNFARNGLFYVFYTRKSPDPQMNGDIVIAEYRRRTNLRARPGSARTLLVIDHPTSFHFGGWMGFAPGGGGLMYVTTGDAASVALGFPQNLDSRLGKLLRFNPRKKQGEKGFVPADNPFVGQPGDDLIYAYGLRNPWRASFDRATGELWLADVGQSLWEEVNRFPSAGSARGVNLGWSLCEGTHAYPQPVGGPEPCGASGTVAPLIEYAHDALNCSIIGGYTYRGVAQPALVGRYFFADYCEGNIWNVAATHGSGDPIDAPLTTGRHITSFGEDALGELYVTVQGGTLWRVVQD